jgi:trigger factor
VERRTDALIASLGLRLPEGPERERALGELRVQVWPRAEKQVRAELLLDAIAARDGVTVSDEEVAAEIAAIAARERRVPEQVRALYDRPEARAALRAKLIRDRILVGLVTRARVVPSAGSVGVADEK